ncbi:MAG: hypothetical protein HKM98_07265 [Gammaproteobacteria bacterium]|nr:hypothetical protein [Gammaproteobacteria bacterium]
MVINDPFAEDNMEPAEFRGYGDPSLELDPDTDTLWMSYSWLDILTSNAGAEPETDFGVRTHLARSDDGGDSFVFVRSINATEMEAHPDTGVMGWSVHEVSTLVREPDSSWQLLWYKYFDPFGGAGEGGERQEFMFWRTLAASPEALGDVSEVWATGKGTSPSYGAPINLSDIPELSDCVSLTEPGLFVDNGITYLATTCLVVVAGERRTDLERVVLLEQEAAGYSYVGVLLDAADAAELGADTLDEADISVARDGSVIMLITPIILNSDPAHQGCVVYEITDLASAQLLRETDGTAILRTVITADGNGLGPGLCTYDAASSTGVLLVITTFANNPRDIEFSLRATGIHP